VNYGLFDPLVTWAESAMRWQVPVGDGSVSVAQGLTACVILLGTWLLTRCLQLVFEEEVFPRLRMPLRLPFAVSAFVRYLMGLVGVLLAMSALGIDLTKVTLLAGALGVGIGFGLQNIFNNFASGLILLVERPINVGDVIELGSLVGTVRRIGIRSSTIRTLQGAEVILPNAELIAQPVINWTLSDRLRRMEIELSVKATGETVETVIALLEAAARESPDVLVEPPPYALFSGFGDDSLNFRLCAWINRYEDESRIASTVRRAILARFDEVGIRIPDPRGGVSLSSSATSRPEPLEPAAQTG
jgi:small-conductance mechanosensitive channel